MADDHAAAHKRIVGEWWQYVAACNRIERAFAAETVDTFHRPIQIGRHRVALRWRRLAIPTTTDVLFQRGGGELQRAKRPEHAVVADTVDTPSVPETQITN